MKVALVNVPKPNLADPGAIKPLGTAYLLAAVRKWAPGVHCEIVDLSSCTKEEASDWLQGCAVYGFSTTSMDYSTATELARTAKQHDPSAVCILGGTHATIAASLGLIIDPVFDTVFTGEGELSLPEYLLHLKRYGKPKSLVKGEPATDLDELPFPARDYKQLGHSILAEHSEVTVPILATRGCPNNCAFCCGRAFWPKRVRYRSPANLAAEITEILDHVNYPVNFWFADDTIRTSPKYFEDLTARLAACKITWRGSIRADAVTPKVAEALARSGCVELAIGVESFDDHVLKVLNKRTTRAQNVKAIKELSDAGISVRLLLMISTPGETMATPERNITALTKLRGCYSSSIVLSRFVPLPGSPIFDAPADYNVELLEADYNKLDFRMFEADMQTIRLSDPVICIAGLPDEQQQANAKLMWEFVHAERERTGA